MAPRTTSCCYFDPLGHAYFGHDGERWPSVTTALKLAERIDARWYTPEAADRGRRVHHLCELIDRGLKPAIPPDVGGEIEAYQQFRRDAQPRYAAIERAGFHQQLKYGGCPDRRLRSLFGQDMRGPLELKTGAEQEWHALQLAAYAGLPRTAGVRFVLYLGKNGRPKLRRMPRALVDDREWISIIREAWQTWRQRLAQPTALQAAIWLP